MDFSSVLNFKTVGAERNAGARLFQALMPLKKKDDASLLLAFAGICKKALVSATMVTDYRF